MHIDLIGKQIELVDLDPQDSMNKAADRFHYSATSATLVSRLLRVAREFPSGIAGTQGQASARLQVVHGCRTF